MADNLISNCVAQAIKGGMNVHLLPSDQEDLPIKTHRPDGSELILKIRDIEMNNVRKIRKMEGIKVIKDFSEIRNQILDKLNELTK